MNYLAINTAGIAVEIVLFINGKIFCRRDTEFKKASSVCLPFIHDVLTETGIKLNDLDFIGVSVGPGSFTGIRIGLSTVRTFAQFANIPVVAVNNLEILAYHKECGRCVAIADAANGFVYAAVYEGKDRKETVAPFVVSRSGLGSFLKTVNEPFTLCEEDSAADTSYALAEAVAAAYLKRGTVPYRSVVPLYIRKPQAEENAGL